MQKVLTIAGSDCSGGAGIQADLKTITVHRCYGMSVITALTAQNTKGVQGVLDVEKKFVLTQLKSIYSDIKPNSVKIGMISNKEIAIQIFSFLKQKKQSNIVLDPVMVSSTNAKLISNDAISYLKNNLIKIATIITPNLHEAEILSGIKINSKQDFLTAAKIISKNTTTAVLIKGGHSFNNADDFLYTKNKTLWLRAKRINNPNTHGTGCTLSSAIACNLAKGHSINKSVKLAKKFVYGAIKTKLKLGKGIGPLNHTYNI